MLNRGMECILYRISNTQFFNKQHFYKQRQAKAKQHTLRLNFHYSKIIRFPHPRYQPKIVGDILKNIQKTSLPALMTLYD